MKIFTVKTFPKKSGENWIRFINKELEELTFVRKPNRLPMHKPSNFLKQAIYIFTGRYLKKYGVKELSDLVVRVRSLDECRAHLSASNPFRLSFMLLCNEGVRWVSPQNRSKWALELHYAFLHEVPPEYLLGFIYQQGSHLKIKPKYEAMIAKIKVETA